MISFTGSGVESLVVSAQIWGYPYLLFLWIMEVNSVPYIRIALTPTKTGGINAQPPRGLFTSFQKWGIDYLFYFSPFLERIKKSSWGLSITTQRTTIDRMRFSDNFSQKVKKS